MTHPIGTFVQVVILPGPLNHRRLLHQNIKRSVIKKMQGKQFTAQICRGAVVKESRIELTDSVVYLIKVEGTEYLLPDSTLNVLDY
jgi:hypothetical protein